MKEELSKTGHVYLKEKRIKILTLSRFKGLLHLAEHEGNLAPIHLCVLAVILEASSTCSSCNSKSAPNLAGWQSPWEADVTAGAHQSRAGSQRVPQDTALYGPQGCLENQPEELEPLAFPLGRAPGHCRSDPSVLKDVIM